MNRQMKGNPGGRRESFWPSLVVEIEPAVKRELHIALAIDQLTMKEWFLHRFLVDDDLDVEFRHLGS